MHGMNINKNFPHMLQCFVSGVPVTWIHHASGTFVFQMGPFLQPLQNTPCTFFNEFVSENL
jgi:hypothetical protein